jgi:hypothetical protein
MIEKFSRARSERDITRVSGTLSPSSILGGRTNQLAIPNPASLRANGPSESAEFGEVYAASSQRKRRAVNGVDGANFDNNVKIDAPTVSQY